jgi:hypothetical protein
MLENGIHPYIKGILPFRVEIQGIAVFSKKGHGAGKIVVGEIVGLVGFDCLQKEFRGSGIVPFFIPRHAAVVEFLRFLRNSGGRENRKDYICGCQE